ncbi:MAG: glycosyltransferase, partial [Syntrophomonadaceae bacterium]|nr:glycosyltransferase [Syntrophomonadaceae bacterium]
MKLITVVIPAFNEENTIAATIRAVQKLDYINRILVVDDGSTDQTAASAEITGAEILKLSPNRGKGGAMNAAVQYIQTDIV